MKRWLLACVLLVVSQSYVFGSESDIQQSTLYPYKSSVILQDEFITGTTTSGTIGSLGWGFTNGTVSQITSETNRPGILRRDTSAVSGTVTSLRINLNTSATFTGNLNHDLMWMIRLNDNDANTTVRVGVANPAFTTDPPSDGIYFEKLDGDTNWFCITKGGTETRTDSGVAVSTNFVTLYYQKLTSSVIFKINGTTVCTHTTDIPGARVSPWTHIVNSAAASKTLDHDYVQWRLYGLTR